jgi:hypothetical protein
MIDHLLERPPGGVNSADGEEWVPLESSDVIEIPLLLSGRQMLALEEAAHHRGLTAGEMVRRLLQDFIAATLACKIGPT